MNQSGFFLVGVLAGLLIAAACGLDLFPEYQRGASSGDTARTPAGAASAAPTTTAAAAAAQEATRERTRGLDLEIEASRERIEELSGRLAESQIALERAGGELDTALRKAGEGEAELVGVRAEISALSGKIMALQTQLERERTATCTLLERFFDSPRPGEDVYRDARLLLGYFATGAPEDLRGGLIAHIRRTNPQVLSALEPRDSISIDESGALAPVASGLGDGEPVPAIGSRKGGDSEDESTQSSATGGER